MHIEGGLTVTVTNTAACANIDFPSLNNNINTLVINSNILLNVSGAITIPRASNGNLNTISVGAGRLTAGSIAFTNGGNGQRHTITITTGTLTVNGDVTQSGSTGSATITFSDAGLLRLGGAFLTSATGTFDASNSTVEYFAAAAQTVGDFTYNNLTLSGSGAKTFPAGTTVNGMLSREGATTVSGTPTYGTDASLRYRGAGAQTTGAEFPNNWTGTGGVFIENASGVTLNAAKNINARQLTIGGTVANSVFNDGGFQLTATGTLNLTSGTFNVGTTTTVTTFPAFATRNYGASANVRFASGLAQVVRATTYPNLAFINNGIKTTAAGTITVAGNWSVNGGAAVLNTNNTSVNVSGNITGSGNITSGTGTITINGDWTNTGTFTCNTGSVVYAGAGLQTIRPLTYYNLSSTGAGERVIAGTVTISNSFTPGTNAYTVTGSTIVFSSAGGQDYYCF